MFPLARMDKSQVLLVVAGHAAREQMLEWIALQACQGEVRVVDGGNQFNVYSIAKAIRRHTARLNDALNNIQISRSFSCYQMTALMERTQTEAIPLFVLDFLFSYYDEDIKLEESQRLLRKAVRSIDRLSQQAPLVISARPVMYNSDRKVLLEELKDSATLIWEAEENVQSQLAAPYLLPLPEEVLV